VNEPFAKENFEYNEFGFGRKMYSEASDSWKQ
jgi:hypothetical protein